MNQSLNGFQARMNGRFQGMLQRAILWRNTSTHWMPCCIRNMRRLITASYMPTMPIRPL